MEYIDTNDNVTAHLSYLKERSVAAIGRYYSSSKWKRITRQEAVAVSSAGLQLFVIFEDNGDPTLTSDNGSFHAQIAMNQARQIGQPDGSAIYFAMEHLPSGYTHTDVPAIKDYIRGIAETIDGKYKIGAYSDGIVLDALLSAGLIDYAWLSASSSFEGSKKFYASGRWAIAQSARVDQDWNGLSVDQNEVKADFGAFSVPIDTQQAGQTLVGALTVSFAANAGSPDGSAIARLLAIASDAGKLQAAQEIAARKLLAYDGEKYPSDGCAITLSVLLQEAGIAIKDTYGALALVNVLKARGWQHVGVGEQRNGDVGTTCGAAAHHGTDHIYVVVQTMNADEMVVADNQKSFPHFRFASGKGRSPTLGFLRAPS